jgi:hypothetical protein
MKNYSFKEKVRITKKISERLIPNTFPNCKIGFDSDLSILKYNELLLEGYSCGIFYSVSDFKNYKIKILQVWPVFHYFIPVNILYKIIKEFFGDGFFYFFQVWNNEKMFYCWISVFDEKGEQVINFYNTKSEIYFEDILCYLMESKEINII